MTTTKVLEYTAAPCERGDEIEFHDGLRWDTGTVLSVKWSFVSGWWIEASCERGTWTGQAERFRPVG